MTKILNLDELESPSDKSIVLKKKTHKFVPLSVGKFIEQLKGMEAYQNRKDVPVSEYLDQMITMVQSAFPTITTEDLKDLPVEHIRLISDFIQGKLQEDMAQAPAVEGEPAPGN